MTYHVLCWKFTKVSKEHIASIFRVKEKAKEETIIKQAAEKAFSLSFILIYYFTFSLSLKMEATCSKISVDFKWTTQCYIWGDKNLHIILFLPIVIANLFNWINEAKIFMESILLSHFTPLSFTRNAMFMVSCPYEHIFSDNWTNKQTYRQTNFHEILHVYISIWFTPPSVLAVNKPPKMALKLYHNYDTVRI
jgi:hypothetical protein